MRISVLVGFLLVGIPQVLGEADGYWENHQDENFRPRNVTGLNYWLHGWLGSYYNGTVTMEMKVVDWTDEDDDEIDKPCRKFVNETIELSYDAILAVTKPLQEDENPVMLVLTPWQAGTNLAAKRPTDHYPYWDLPFRFMTVPSPPMLGYTIEPDRTWNVTTDRTGDSSFSISGAQRFDPEKYESLNHWMAIKFNHSTCISAHNFFYAGSIATPSKGLNFGTLDVKTPRLRGQFDNTSASLTIDGIYKAFPRKIRSQTPFRGPITISFVGNIDRDRSDEMLPATNDTPVWNQTLGFEESAAVRLGAISMSFGYALVIASVYLTLLWTW